MIPARGGSKRIPKKNIKPFLGRPLIAYSIEAALQANIFNKVIVSTDDDEVSEIARSYGAEVPFMRPADLSGDFVGLDAVIHHALNWYLVNKRIQFDHCCMIYATAPMIKSEYLVSSFDELAGNENYGAGITVTEMPYPAQRCYGISDQTGLFRLWPEFSECRSQDLCKTYQDAAHFNWFNLSKWSYSEDEKSKVNIMPIVLPRNLVQDIDDQSDWEMAEILFRATVLGK